MSAIRSQRAKATGPSHSIRTPLTMGLFAPDVAFIALVLSSGSLVVSIASFVLAISAKRQAKKAATLGFRVEAINHLRAVLSDINDGGITSRTVDTIHDALRSTELVFSRDVREKLHRASATIFRLNTPTARRATHYPKEIIGLKDELQTDWPPLRGPGGMLV